MPVEENSQPKAYGNFRLMTTSLSNNTIPVYKYVSEKTGLTVVIGEIEGPLVNGYICFGTEAHDDDGLPHTLEHLIFLGSEDYPYKGVLDLLANRCLASGTNAWTDTDHTCYTMTTAGEAGFLSLLPIYLDHVFFPTLTESAFITEVYHINGEGKDGGVVFTEMQGVENTAEEVVSCNMLKLVYPGKCGYKSRTGGVMENLRTSTNNDKVKAYHKQFYRPENCFIIIAGCTNPLNVLKVLGPIEEKILSKGDRGGYVRPWQSIVPPLLESTELEVEYPSDDQSNGMVHIGWRGPSVVKEYYKFNALSTLLKYLTDTPVSPLPKAFVDIQDPYCSRVSYSLTENSESLMMIQFSNVPLDKINLIKDKLFELLGDFVKNTDKQLDMKRLATVIHRSRLESMANLEDTPYDLIAFTVIGFMLYGNTKEDFHQRLNYISDLDKMEKEPAEFWLDLLKTYFIDGVSVTIKGIPSIQAQKKIAEEEEERVIKRVKEFGPEGLANLEKTVEKAVAQNNEPPPDEMLKFVPVPSIDSIHFHSIKCYTSKSPDADPRFSFNKVPLNMQLTDLHTNFAYIYVLMDSSKIKSDLRPYLNLLTSSFLQSPVQRGDTLVPYEEVVHQLEEDTVAAEIRIGVTSGKTFNCGPYPDTVCLMLQVEPKKYDKGIKWLKEILYNVVITTERLKIIAMKIINDVPEYKRSGSKMVYDLLKGILFGKENNHYGTNVLVQYNFLTQVLSRLDEKDGIEAVLKEIQNVRDVLTNPENMTAHLAVNLDILTKHFSDPAAIWEHFLPTGLSPIRVPMNSTPEWKIIKENLKESCVTGIGSVESSFLCMASPCITDYNHPDLAPLLVFLQYVSQFEGPMWKLIRGLGFAYSYYIIPRPSQGKLFFSLYRASNIIGAYKQAKLILEERLKPNTEWDQNLFESAKSSVIYETVQKEKCIGNVVTEALLSFFKSVSPDYNRKLVKKLSNVSIEDLVKIGPKYIAPMFDPDVTRVSVVCHPSKVEEISKNLNELGLRTTPYSTVEESFAVLW
ncbi:uncharacterized protein C05D11.1-like [Cimex lectularius]|uniref:Presequence protease, mitochondrial n=1 Tax=Cimex lectularius TaxID=79782 RepID=A0A8I6S4R6_CIMLE|nr:uncharacterized protein C05D11.1-like [Cimex lectularius]